MSSFRPAIPALVLAPTLVAFALACGTAKDRGGEFVGSSGSSGGASGTSGGVGSSGFGMSSGASGTSGTSGDINCAAVSAKTEKAKVDIIFVIDDSGSMTEEMA